MEKQKDMTAPKFQEDQIIASAASSRRIDGGYSNRISSVDLDNRDPSFIDHDHQFIIDGPKKSGWRRFLSFIGPGFLVSMAYLDPNNLETDMQAGANHGYELLWVIFIGTVFAVLIQSLAANLGVTTGKHLAELCKAEYSRNVKICLWLLAETAVIAADIPEVGTAFALKLLFHIPLWVGVLITGFSTLFLLCVQRYGVRKLELLISLLILVLAGCFFGEMSYVKPPAKDIIKGIFIPKLSGQGATGDFIALVGSLVNPHNLFLHSALVLSRNVPHTVRHINDACRNFLIESGFALFIAFLINLSIISVSAAVCSVPNLTPQDQNRCSDLNLDNASFLLKNVLGKSSSTVYAIALLASGQSSTITGTYAGQFIMQGFLDIRMRKWLRNLMTRCIAITPSIIVVIIGGSSGAARLVIIASMILSFQLPFILIPLLKFSSSTPKMGPYKNSIFIIVITWILGLSIVGINVFYLIKAFVDWLMNNKLPQYGNFLIGIVVFPFMAIYMVAVLYLTLRKDRVVTFIEPIKIDVDQTNLEIGQPKAIQTIDQDHTHSLQR